MSSSASSLEATLGGLLVSVLIATFLYAITCFQAFLYWRTKFNDYLGVRVLVWAVWVFETMHTTCFWFYLYTILVKYYGVPQEMEQRHWSVTISIVFHGLITACVQSYYSYRVYVLSSGRWLIPTICWMLCGMEAVGALALAILFYRVGPVVWTEKWEFLATIDIGVDLAVGVVNTTMLCYYLHRRKTGYRSTDQMVTKIIEWSVESGLVTALAALAILIACLVAPDTAVYISMTSFYGKFFSNALLASLNGRGPFSPFRPMLIPPTQSTMGTMGISTGSTVPNFAVHISETTEMSSFSSPNKTAFDGVI
ncbi:hypothetical protein BT96DRAFT_1026875 [Gymnopus androsaceus JB14]|uniref:DUF6534 domain-containing protein n=1 Tax=Gymnopus androsaceus JB14 TaxID=1447944 RepID=A0A6A4GGJ2_9AGAR|nr:hypothetical protein BT96DRAFT_1026875 [Gymnopus androsaceus JB14]